MSAPFSPTSPQASQPDHYWQSQLNESQWQAVCELERPLLVIAGAGSGKTRVLTYKIAYMLDRGFAAEEILALTFTNKAAREMNERIAQIVGAARSKGMWSGTFHSIFARILRLEAEQVNYRTDYTIYDTADAQSLLKSIIKEMGLDDKVYKTSKIASRISTAKNFLLLPKDYAANSQIIEQDQRDCIPKTALIYQIYMQRCQQANAMDFDDLLLYTYLLFAYNEEIRQKYVQRFAYLLIDEYQDTSFAQHRILEQLTKERKKICVVGDDAQSIYAFRGANIDYILNFEQQYPTSLVVKLEQNYRSTQNIVNAANSIIRHNKGQIPKRVFSLNEEGEKLHLIVSERDKEEAAKVAGIINKLHRHEQLGYDKMAILYRTNAQSRSFEDIFRSQQLPYRIYGGLSFYQRKEIKDVLAYLRLLINPEDETAFKRVVNYPARGIGNTTLQKLFTASRQYEQSLWCVAQNPSAFGLELSKATCTRLARFCGLISDFQHKAQSTSVHALTILLINETGIKDELNKESGSEGENKRQNVEELLGAIHSFETEYKEEQATHFAPIAQFLSELALQTDADQKEDNSPKITLMTVHAAKGLEFEAVFITGMEEGLFPSQNAYLNPREMEEERRLFYVAVTRAKQFCYLTYSRTRYRHGQLSFGEESSFVREIDAQYLQTEQGALGVVSPPVNTALHHALFGNEVSSPHPTSPPPRRETRRETYRDIHRENTPTPQAPTWHRLVSIPSSSSSEGRKVSGKSIPHGLTVGTRIVHDKFGFGTVLATEGADENAKAIINFDDKGQKKLLLKFAKYRIVED